MQKNHRLHLEVGIFLFLLTDRDTKTDIERFPGGDNRIGRASSPPPLRRSLAGLEEAGSTRPARNGPLSYPPHGNRSPEQHIGSRYKSEQRTGLLIGPKEYCWQ